MRHLIAAIDLGTTKVVCAVGEKTPAGIKIIAHSQAPSKGVLRGEVINIQHVDTGGRVVCFPCYFSMFVIIYKFRYFFACFVENAFHK